MRFGWLAAVVLTGCKLPAVQITGSLDVEGDEPSAYSFEVYSALSNTDAFDTKFCDKVETDGTCYGRVIMSKLGKPEEMDEPAIDGKNFTLSGIEADIAYLLKIGSADPAVLCDTAWAGMDEETKLVTSESAIKFDIKSPKDFALPHPAALHCSVASDEPDPPPPDVEDPPPPPPPDSDDIPPPANPAWDQFTMTGKGGSPLYGDAGAGPAVADVECGANFPSVLEVHGHLENAAADQAFIRVQFGSGDAAEYRTFPTNIVNGEVHQEISLTGGYAVVQLDADETLDGEGESNPITFCEPSDRPAQEFMMIVTWDKDDTDVDSHVFAGGEEVAYYNLQSSWGMLDIDDVDGFGPETLTSNPDVSGLAYDVRIHYYSDHGNGPANASVRIIYAEPDGGVCDVSVTQTINSYEWWDVGTFAPGMGCPQ